MSPVETYTQSVSVEFRSPESARRASIRIAGLYHDLKAAFSTRMDDNNANNVQVAEAMGRFGQKGTFFLNDPSSWWEDNASTGSAMMRDPGLEVPRKLLADGHSIGAHTLSHDYLPALSKNAAFAEIMGSRIALEIHTGSPVSTFTYPFMYYRSALRDGLDRTDLEAMLLRTGIVQLAEDGYNSGRDSGLLDAHFIAVDGTAVGGSMGETVVDRECRDDRRPLLLVSMHAWPDHWGGRSFPRLEEIYRRWSGRSDWWYCNANEYAAYRYQVLHTLLAVSVEGSVLTVALGRPSPLDLGDWTPLTLVVDGVDPQEVRSASSAGSKVRPCDIPGPFAFDLDHDEDHGPVAVFGLSGNPGNGDRLEGASVVAGVRALLHRGADHVKLLVKNEGDYPLFNLRATFRLPLRWEEGVARRRVERLEPGGELVLQLPLSERPDPDGYTDGRELDVVQLDFVERQRIRIFALCDSHCEEPPRHFPCGGFVSVGPLPGDLAEIDPQVFSSTYPSASSAVRICTVPWGQSLSWRSPTGGFGSFLEPDIIPTTAQANTPDIHGWHSSVHHPHTRMSFVLCGTLSSPEAMTVRAVTDLARVVRLELNGTVVADGKLLLKSGPNTIRILYQSLLASESQFNEGNYGCYFRLVGADGRRPKGIRFERPDRAR